MTEILNLDVEPASSAAQRLAQAISDLSEDCWCAGWLDDCEHVLWEMLGITEPREWGMGYVTPEDAAKLKALSDEAGGWVYWHVPLRDDGMPPEDRWLSTGPRFVAMADWLDRHGWRKAGLRGRAYDLRQEAKK